ncbi:hypothetical protein HP556_02965 [Tardiphaga robiniae]|nr:hypothetical protein [Tardiphaga robiniae]
MAELEWRQGQGGNLVDQRFFDVGRDEIVGVAQTFETTCNSPALAPRLRQTYWPHLKTSTITPVPVQLGIPSTRYARLGQSVNLRFSAFNRRTTPEIVGSLSRISADISQDQKTGVSYYLGRVSLSAGELSKLVGLKLLPGMPVEAFVRTEDRTVLSYLVKPLHDQIAKAFRER